MKTNSYRLWILGLLLFVSRVEAVLTSNRWQVGDGKWETAANWTQGAPSPTQAICIIASIFPSVTTVDTATVTQHVINSCMTISNLVVGGLTTHNLFLNNANNTPGNIGLTIINQMSLTSSGSLSITNSDMKVIGVPFGAAIFNDGSILLNTGTMIVTQDFGDIFVGSLGEGTLTVSNGTLRAGFVDVPNQTGTRGTLNIAGGTNFFRNLIVGFGRTGTVWITGGQLTVSASGTGVAAGGTNIIGSSSSTLPAEMIVSNGTWTADQVLIEQAATLTIAGGTNNLASLHLAHFTGNTSTVWVTGGRLNVTNGTTVVGKLGGGNMVVSNGIFQARDMYVGTNAGSVGMFTVAGGTNTLTSVLHVGSLAAATGAVWITDGLLVITNSPSVVGVSGVGQLTLSNGTLLTSSTCVGSNSGSRGALTIAGGTNFALGLQVGLGGAATGSVWVTGGALLATNGGATIGVSGVGQLTVSNGLYRTQNVVAGLQGVASGTLRFAGGTTELSSLFLGSNGSTATGTVWLTGGDLLNPNGTFVGLNGVGSMTVSNGTWQGSSVLVAQNAGSKGTLNIAGGTNFVSATMILGNANCTSTGIVNMTAGALSITNEFGFGTLDVRSGTFTMSGGIVAVDSVILTNSCGHFARTGGTLIYSNAVLVANRDDDGDGISNGYEQSHGLDPLNPADANLDSDGDGQSNLQEFQAGTDATNNASAFRITDIVRTNNDIRVTWMTGPGKTNALERTAGDASGSYSNNFAAIFTVTNTVGTTTNHLDAGAATNVPSLYYRIRLVP